MFACDKSSNNCSEKKSIFKKTKENNTTKTMQKTTKDLKPKLFNLKPLWRLAIKNKTNKDNIRNKEAGLLEVMANNKVKTVRK